IVDLNTRTLSEVIVLSAAVLIPATFRSVGADPMAQLAINAASRTMLSKALGQQRLTPKCVPHLAVSRHAHVVQGVPQRRNARDTIAQRSVIARGKVEKISGEQLEVEIANRDTTIVVDFFATWCGPCLLLARELEQVAEELSGKVKVVKIDVDENPDLSNMLRIQGLPTIVFIPKENGKPALRTEGWLPAAQIKEILEQLETGATPQQQQGGQEQGEPQQQ
ncbi:hypothetical protein Agub_g10233, partial [Astrephomene gubernaculifera]